MTSAISLDDKYTAGSGSIFLSGTQALVRLCLMQRARDELSGLNTAGFVSGYRGLAAREPGPGALGSRRSPRRTQHQLVTAGKAYTDTRQALEDLGIDESCAGRLGIRLYKLAMTWPLEPSGLRTFARDHLELLIVEEKRPVIEEQRARRIPLHGL